MQVGLSHILRVPPDTSQPATSRDASPAQARLSAPQTEVQEPAPPAAGPREPTASVVLKIQPPAAGAVARGDGLVYSNKGLLARAPEVMPLESPGAPGSTHTASDFVSHAVSAMRQFTDEAERRQRYALLDSAPASQAPANHLSGLKKLSTRFSLFA